MEQKQETRAQRRRREAGRSGLEYDLGVFLSAPPETRARTLRELLRDKPLDSDGYPAMVAAVEAFTGGHIDPEYAERAMDIAASTSPSLWDTSPEQLASILSMLFMFLDGRDMTRPPETLLLEIFMWGFEAGWDWGKQFPDLGTSTASKVMGGSRMDNLKAGGLE